MIKKEPNLFSYGEYILITLIIFLIGCFITGLIEISVIPMISGLILGCFISNILFVMDQNKLNRYRQSHPSFRITPKERLITFIISYWILPFTALTIIIFFATKYIHE